MSFAPPGHLTDDDLLELAGGRLGSERRAGLLVHADGCPDCRRLLAGVGRAVLSGSPALAGEDGGEGDDDDGVDLPLVRGTAVGRYVVEELLGAGGMGEVHAAYDPELDRRVALKVLRTGRPAAEQQRLAREAQTMARLSHPNVVPVHDVGSWNDRFFIAMELIDGETLAAWLRAAPRPWPKVIAMFDQAGRGLAAAHQVGIVHRDFKPDNALVGKDGRVRVSDFGVARAHVIDDAPSEPGRGDPSLTRTGTLLGTPAYMAPEVLGGAPASAASDQFGFCVALYEGLYGERPFRLDERSALAPSARSELAPTPPGRRVPSWLRRIVVRGMASDPTARWPSMAALLAQLAKVPARRRRLAIAAALIVAAGGAALARPAAAPSRAACAEDASLGGIWDAPARASARQAFGSATHRFETFAASVDAWIARWQHARARSCEETLVNRAQPREVGTLRAACFDRQLDDLRAVAQVAAEPSPRLVERALNLAGGLPDPSRCDAATVVARRDVAPRDQATGDESAAIATALARVQALDNAGRFDDAIALAEPLVPRAEKLGHLPTFARALERLGRVYTDVRRGDPAKKLLVRAHRLAAAVGDDETELRALAALVFVVGLLGQDHDEGLALARDAEILAERTGDREVGANLSYYLGIIHVERHELAEARRAFERSRDDLERLYGPADYRIANALNGLGVVSAELEDLARGRRENEDALALYERTLGADDPRTANQQLNVAALLLMDVCDYAAAKDHVEVAIANPELQKTPNYGTALAIHALARARLGEGPATFDEGSRGLAIAEKAYGAGHGAVAAAQVELGDLLVELDRDHEATERYRAALAIWHAQRGDESPEAAETTLLLAEATARAGDEVNLPAAMNALSALRAKVRADGPRIAVAETRLCHILVLLGRKQEAEGACAAALVAAEVGLPPDHPMLALALGATAETRGGDVALLERALAILERRRGDVVLTADVRLGLARAVAARDPQRARGLAAAARDALVAAVGPGSRRVAAIEGWLRTI